MICCRSASAVAAFKQRPCPRPRSSAFLRWHSEQHRGVTPSHGRSILRRATRPTGSGPSWKHHLNQASRVRTSPGRASIAAFTSRGDVIVASHCTRALALRTATEQPRRNKPMRTSILWGAHVAMITTDEALGVYGAVDCGAYVANFLLAAASMGVATIPQAALAARPQRVRDFFGLPAERLVVCGISLGYADPDHPANSFRTARANSATAVQWEGNV